MAGLMVASGHGILLALLAYGLSGAVLMVAAAGAQQLVAAATLRPGRDARRGFGLNA